MFYVEHGRFKMEYKKLKELCEGKMLPPIDIGKEHYEALFDLCISAVSEATGVSPEMILGRRRMRAVADARMMAYKMVRHEIGVGECGYDAVLYHDHKCPGYHWIADRFKNTHGAVIHGVKRVSLHLVVDRKLFNLYTKALSLYEIYRAEYMSTEVKSVTNLQIHALQASVETIKKSIKTYEDALAETERSLEEAKGGENENMVQEQCTSNG
tara:strand:- start:8568 stop:9203 length:636 start_codon:yes stop_codon:yes gene_type:complete